MGIRLQVRTVPDSQTRFLSDCFQDASGLSGGSIGGLESKRPVKFSKARPEQSLGYMFWQTSNLWQRKMVKALKPTGLTPVQLVLLAGVAWLERSAEPITQVRLARQAKTYVMMTSQVLKKSGI